MIIKKLKIGPTGFTVSLEDRTVEMIRSNVLYRIFIRPVMRFFSSMKDTMGKDGGAVIPVNESDINRQVKASGMTSDQEAILSRISGVEWYHSIDLGHGIITPGLFDHRPLLSQYHLPDDLSGKRILDVATYDGFWAFEFEKRGADEIVAMDIDTWNEIDIPPRIRATAPKEMLDKKTGAGFNIAKDILGSKVQRGIMNVYTLGPEWMGKFDIAFCSDLLLHLMNPMKALQNIRSVVSGHAYIVDVYSPEFGEDDIDPMLRYIGGSDRMVWWRFGLGSLKKMIKDAGFSEVETVSKFEFNVQGQQEKHWHVVFKAYP